MGTEAENLIVFGYSFKSFALTGTFIQEELGGNWLNASDNGELLPNKFAETV